VRHLIIVLALIASWFGVPAGQEVTLPNGPDSLKMAVIGDNGTGDPPEYDVGRQMATAREKFPFDVVLMLGDNMYGRQSPEDFVTKFERPYAPLIAAGVEFYATLGNHDKPDNRFYKPWHMNGARYYTFVKKNVRFFVLDTNYIDRAQYDWFEGALKSSQDAWKICYFHHPLYSDAGRHGSQVDMRVMLEPLLVKYGVQAVFSGHDHVYERIKPQKGITYFVSGAGGQLRSGDIVKSPLTAAAFDTDRSFMLVEIADYVLTFEAISRTGVVVDSGTIDRRPTT
jgi:predicted MPP superfamily phosphohydrolase